MYKLAITTFTTAMFLTAVDYGAARSSDSRPGSHSISIRGSVVASDGNPVAGTDICFYEGAGQRALGCAPSGSDGSFSFSVAANTRIVVGIRKDGFVPTVRVIEAAATDPHQAQLAFLVTAPGAEPITASVTRGATDSHAPLFFTVSLDRERTSL